MRGSANLTQDRSTPMTDEAMSPLRRRMIEDVTIRKLSPKTQRLHAPAESPPGRLGGALLAWWSHLIPPIGQCRRRFYPVNSRALRMDSRGRRCRGGHGVPVFVLINRFGIYQHTVESAERLGNCPQDSSAV